MITSVLLVDDDTVTNFLHQRLITKLISTKDINTVSNGREAINYLLQRAAEGKEYPSLILLDINMPVMDGFEFLEKFETIKEPDCNVLIFMLTSSSNTADQNKATKYNIQGYINKPLNELKVRNILEKYI